MALVPNPKSGDRHRVILTRRGPKMIPPLNSFNPIDNRYNNAVMGGFRDSREFTEEEIQNWANLWEKRDNIVVEKVGKKLFLFFCEDAEDCIDLLNHNQINYKGALMALKPWFFGASARSVQAEETALWVRFEGIPFLYVQPAVVAKMAEKIGHPLLVEMPEEESRARPHLKARIRINITKPLAPGCYFEYEDGHLVWVSFRYEKVFRFCKKCGKIGHKTIACKTPIVKAEKDIMEVMRRMNEGNDNLIFDDENIPLYTNKIKGLPGSPKNTTSILKLIGTPKSPVGSSGGEGGDDDMDDTSDDSGNSGDSSNSDNSSGSDPRLENPRPANYGGSTFRMTAPCMDDVSGKGRFGNCQFLQLPEVNKGMSVFNDNPVLNQEREEIGNIAFMDVGALSGIFVPKQLKEAVPQCQIQSTPQMGPNQPDFSFPTPPCTSIVHNSHPFGLLNIEFDNMGPLGEIFSHTPKSGHQPSYNQINLPQKYHTDINLNTTNQNTFNPYPTTIKADSTISKVKTLQKNAPLTNSTVREPTSLDHLWETEFLAEFPINQAVFLADTNLLEEWDSALPPFALDSINLLQTDRLSPYNPNLFDPLIPFQYNSQTNHQVIIHPHSIINPTSSNHHSTFESDSSSSSDNFFDMSVSPKSPLQHKKKEGCSDFTNPIPIRG